MAGAIGPGDWVEYLGRPNGYVNPDAARFTAGCIYQVGCVYRVTEVGRRCADGAGNAWDSLRTVETPLPFSVPIACFRPVYRPSAEFTTSLLRKATEPSELEPV
jgi:hypothetical protein